MQPWSLAVLAELAGERAARAAGEAAAAAAAPLACLQCRDGPREWGFLHGGTVHLGVCSECVCRLPGGGGGGGALQCPVCFQVSGAKAPCTRLALRARFLDTPCSMYP